MATVPLADRDYFTDRQVLLDPYEYFESLRASGPVHRMKARDIVIVTGHAEGVDVLLDTHNFSSILNPDPLAPLSFDAAGLDDLEEAIAKAKPANPALELMVTYDGVKHANARSLLNPLFTPSRLKANEAFMRAYAEDMVKGLVARGACELIAEVATPFVTMVIADLLGVPDEDREKFREIIDAGPPPGNMDAADQPQQSHPLMFMAGFFMRYMTERRANPQGDVMSELANARYPDGSEVDVLEAVKSAMFLFAAGQDTSAKLIGNSLRFLCENPDMQQQLREDRSLIGPFLEECLRLEGSTKATFRLAKRRVRIGDVEVPPGQRVGGAMPAAHRDPRRRDDPHAFRLNRPKIREHLAFGRGAHVCAGAPLARAEVAVLLDRMLEHTSAITLDEAHHGPAGARKVEYEASFIIRGLANLHVQFAPR
ncbi:MAG TPA: cytochrome P450 [Novosphingobium sp.]|nr:cytochrome P450 [Novosphingobium sp.]